MTREFQGSRIFRIAAFAAGLALCGGMMSGRILPVPAAWDLVPLVRSSPLIFRGVVLGFKTLPSDTFPRRVIATIRVDRSYRGEAGQTVQLRYNEPMGFAGHDCIHLPAGTHWLFFAKSGNEPLEFVDDCFGAVSISPRLASQLPSSGVFGQIEADLLAGLTDANRAGRLLSVQRLGGLKMVSSREALWQFIERGDPGEQAWATYALLRTGDVLALARARDLLRTGSNDAPIPYFAWELGQFRDVEAIPDLIDIANSSPDSEARKYALASLGSLRSVEALPVIGARLADPDGSVRFSAREAMRAITGNAACALPPGHSVEMEEPQVVQCLEWWNAEGKRAFKQR